MRAVVTGGAGYIGSALVASLLEMGYSVLSVDNMRTGEHRALDGYRGNAGLKLVLADVRDGAGLVEAFRAFGDVDVLFHLAAVSGVEACDRDPEYAVGTNVLGTYNVLEAARGLGVRRVVLSSSAAVYGVPLALPVDEEHPLRPVNLYGVTKVAGEKLFSMFHMRHGVETIVLRLGNAYGVGLYTRGDSVIPLFVRLGLEGRPLTVFGDGGSTRDFVHVLDIVNAMRLSAEAESDAVGGQVFNVGGETRKIGDLARGIADAIRDATGNAVEVVHLPPRTGEPREFSYSKKKIEAKIAFRTRWTIRAGVKQLIDYYLQAGNHQHEAFTM